MDQERIFKRLADLLEKYQHDQYTGDFLALHDQQQLRQALELEQHEGSHDWDHIFDWVEKYLAYAVKTQHPGFVNRMWSGANLPSIIGEMVAAATNTSACTYESAPVSTLMEKYMLQAMLDIVGFRRGEGQMTTGSSNGNMIAMMAARMYACPEVKQGGVTGCRPLYACVNEEAHYSFDKAANILGIGIDHLLKVPVTPRGEMDVAALEQMLGEVQAAGGRVFFVAATAGTTVRGSYDAIAPLVALRDRYQFWLHVDGAWGGAAIFSERLRGQFLGSVELADSFTWDFHKMLGAALMCNVLLINNRPHTLGQVCSGGDESYLFHDEEDNEVCDLGAVSLQCGRRVDSLKWFLDWKYYGRVGLARRVERFYELAVYAEQWVERSDTLEMVFPRTSFNVCFRMIHDENEVNAFNLALRTRLYREKISLVGYATINSVLFLRLLITNRLARRTDIDRFFTTLLECGRTMKQEARWRTS